MRSMSHIEYLNALNPKQREAVAAAPGHQLVLAGAGSGKTRVLVSRIAWLLQHEPITPANILAVTFTNKAAREMRERLGDILQLPLHSMWVGTFHGLAHRLLRAHWQEADLPQQFQIIDSEDQSRIIKRIHKAMGLDTEKWPPRQSQWFINGKKDEGVRAGNIQDSGDYLVEKLTKVYREYERVCQQNGLVDFAELLLRSHELWLKDATLLAHYQDRFKYILVDEFQDTNSIQYAWLKMLAGKNAFLTAVGDDDQSIYGWRGAKIENIHRFTREFSNTTTVRLEQNYRSTKNILSAANSVIENNCNRLGKELWTEDKAGDLITVYAAYNEVDEAKYIIDSVSEHLRNGVARSEAAILYRSNAQSRVLEEQLLLQGIPYRIYGGMKFFERAEIKDALAYLRLLMNRDNDISFERIVNTPARSIGNVTLTKVREYARGEDSSLFAATRQMLRNNSFSGRATNALSGFIQLMEDVAEEIADLTLPEAIAHVLHRSGLREFFNNDKSEKGKARVENLNELISAARQFEVEENDDLVTAFLSHAALEAGEGQADASEDSVQLMTLHSAKGLEFPIVFIAGMEAGLFPHQMSLDEEKLEEERRLCYVGMTRARQKLYLTYANSRRVYGIENYRQPSRFLREIPKELIESYGAVTQITRPTTFVEKPSYNVASEIADTGLKVGQQVQHKKFGEGVILNYEGSGSHTRIQVQFARHGTKWLVAAYANLSA
ncbi:MAG: DNA helicase II [Gammaproteobacteria bacterium]|nr:DNA helicase II [Gammaproteobacteria bacterium]